MTYSRTFAVKVTRDGSLAAGVKGELLKMYLHTADGDDLVKKGNEAGQRKGKCRRKAMGYMVRSRDGQISHVISSTRNTKQGHQLRSGRFRESKSVKQSS